MEKFEAQPLLRCQDVVLASQFSLPDNHTHTDKSAPVNLRTTGRVKGSPTQNLRRYNTTWDLASAVSYVREYIDRPISDMVHTKQNAGWSRFNTIKLLARKIQDLCRPVRFYDQGPTEPFTVTRLDTFEFEEIATPQTHIRMSTDHPDMHAAEWYDESFEDPIEVDLGQPDLDTSLRSKALLRSSPVDGKRSCAYHVHCTLPPCERSMYCLWHHRVVAHALNARTYSPGTLRSMPRTPQEKVTFRAPRTKAWWLALRLLHQINRDYVVWLIDVEFVTVTGFNAVPLQLTIRDGKTGKHILSTLVDHSSRSLVDLSAELTALCASRQKKYASVEVMFRHYRSDHTTGLSLEAIGRFIIECGFNPNTHRVLSWYSAWDIVTFSRAIQNDRQLLSPQDPAKYRHLLDAHGEECYQAVQLGYMLKHCSDLECGQLGHVYQSLFKGEFLDMHDAENDTWALFKVYQRMIAETRQWMA